MWLCHAVLLVFSVSCLVASILISRKISSINCVEKHSSFSPGLEIIEDEYRKIRWEARYDVPSPYKGPPSEVIDAAWGKITTIGPMSISETELHEINPPQWPVRLPEESGGGYMGLVEFVHQIHCLDLLRKQTYPEYYKEDYNSSSWHEHADHCVDTLLQKLMCDSDVSILTYAWIEGKKTPQPNLNVEHKCRNFDMILEWALEKQAAAPAGGNVLRDGDWKEFSAPPHHP